jgi:MFS family permease
LRLYSPEILRRTFSSLRHRSFMMLWTGTVVSQSGDWMDQIALNWLVLEISHSPLSLGLVNLCRAIPMILLIPLGGVAADRWQRRRIMMVTQTIAMCLAFLLGALITVGVIALWQVYLIAALRGAVMSFNLPARQSMISDLVPKQDLPNAVALHSATMNLTRVLGPSIGGVLIALFGTAWLFYLNGLSFLAILRTLKLLPDTPRDHRPREGALTELREGWHFLRNHRLLSYLVFLAVIPMFFGMPYMTMLAVFAHDVLNIGPAGLGMLTSTAALGSITGALIAAGRSREPTIKRMLSGMVCFGIALLCFAFSAWVAASLVFLFIAGASNVTYNSTNNTLIQLNVPDAYRGRVLSMLYINRGVVPLGTAAAGWLAEVLGAPDALGIMAVCLLILGVIAFALRPAQPPTVRAHEAEEISS